MIRLENDRDKVERILDRSAREQYENNVYTGSPSLIAIQDNIGKCRALEPKQQHITRAGKLILQERLHCALGWQYQIAYTGTGKTNGMFLA